MPFKHFRTERCVEARRRLAERPLERPSQTTRPRGNAVVDEKDLQRSLERLEALVGR
jgi:hypothetical protein